MARRSSNNLGLRAGQLTAGGAPVGSIQQVRALGRNLGYGRVDRPTSKQLPANRKAGIDAYKQRVRGVWGKG